MTDAQRRPVERRPWFQILHEMELEMLDPDMRSDPTKIRDLLRDDFIEVGSTGRVYDKQVLLEMLSREVPSPVVVRDFSVHKISSDTALVTYRSVGKWGHEARRSSIWVREGDEWSMVFHQGTRISSGF